MRRLAAAFDQHLQGVVNDGRVTARLVDDRENLLDIVPEKRAREGCFTRVHPVHIAAQGVDLAVVRQVAEGLRALPSWEGIGGESLVNQCDRGLEERVAEVRVEVRNLGSDQQALVADGPARDRARVVARQLEAKSF